MDSIKVTSGLKRIAINDDPNNVIEFNPDDVLFAERFYTICEDFDKKQVEFNKKSKELDERKEELTENGLPVVTKEGIQFLREVCTFMREKIDYVFGEGTSQQVFGDTLSLEMIGQFLEGITPFIQNERTEKIKKYTNPSTKSGTKRVMK